MSIYEFRILCHGDKARLQAVIAWFNERHRNATIFAGSINDEVWMRASFEGDFKEFKRLFPYTGYFRKLAKEG